MDAHEEAVHHFTLSETPDNADELAFVRSVNAEMITDSAHIDPRDIKTTNDNFKRIAQTLKEKLDGETFDALLQMQAGGFDVFAKRKDGTKDRVNFQHLIGLRKLERDLYDIPEEMIRGGIEVYAQSHRRVVDILGDAGIIDENTRIISTSYREAMTGYTHDLKRLLEYLIGKLGEEGFNTLALALPRAATTSSKMFESINLFILFDYLRYLKGEIAENRNIQSLFTKMEEALAKLTEVQELFSEVEDLFGLVAGGVQPTDDMINNIHGEFARNLLKKIEKIKTDKRRTTLQTSGEVISGFVRTATGLIIADKMIAPRSDWKPGETQRVTTGHLLNYGTEEPVTVTLPTPTEVPEKLKPYLNAA